MTDPESASRPDPTPESATETVDFVLPDEASMRAEVGDDRRHERFLLRAALVAAILVAMVIATRIIWP